MARDMSVIFGLTKKPTSGLKGAPPPFPGAKSAAPEPSMPDDSDFEATEGEKPEGDEAKMSPDRALVSHADETCGNCNNFHPDTGMCDEVDGQFKSDDRCWAEYEPKNGSFSGRADGMEGGTAYAGPDDAA